MIQPAELARWRLERIGLATPSAGSGADVVRGLLAVQSQDFAPALWSLAQRCRPLPTHSQLVADFNAGRFLRTHVMRPTWHFVAPEDVGWLQRLTSHRVHAVNAPYYRRSGLDESTLARSRDIIGEAVTGAALTRGQIGSALAARGIQAAGLKLNLIMMAAELDRLIISGPMAGKQHTYMLTNERTPPSPPLEPDEGLAHLAIRYFAAHGPATLKDLRWWSGLPLADLRRGIAAAASALTRLPGEPTFYLPADVDGPPTRKSRRVRLLQAYDEYGIGYAESRNLLNLVGLEANPVFNNQLLAGTQLAGCWKSQHRSGSLTIEVSPYFLPTSSDRASLARAVAEHGKFWQSAGELAIREQV